MLDKVFGVRCLDGDIVWPVVVSDLVIVVSLFSRQEPAPNFLLSNQAMFVHVTAHVGVWVIWPEDQHVSVHVDSAPALPIRIVLSGLWVI